MQLSGGKKWYEIELWLEKKCQKHALKLINDPTERSSSKMTDECFWNSKNVE